MVKTRKTDVQSFFSNPHRKIARSLTTLVIISVTGYTFAADCTVKFDSLQQRMSGFGGSTAWAGGLADNLINDLFSPTTGCGLTLVRMRIATNGTTGSGEITIAKKAQALGAAIWAAPWSPQASWKDNNNVNNGGSLLPANYQNWADRLVAYVKNLQTQGINLRWISAQNEPNWTATYESCRYTPAQLTNFVGNYLGPSLEKAGLTTRIIAPEVINWGGLKPYGDSLLKSENAMKYCDVIASHSYGDEPKAPNYPYKLVIEKKKELWETEYGFDQFAGDESMTPGIAIAKQMHGQIVNGPVSAYHTWWIIPADGVNGTASNGLVMKGHVIQRGYVMGNYSRFVRPGSYRIAATASPATGIMVTAYRNDSSKQVIIVAINENTAAKEQKFVFEKVSVPTVTPWETSDAVKLTARAQVTAGSSFTWTLPAKSVVSFVGQYSGAPVEKRSNPVTRTPDAIQSVELSGSNGRLRLNVRFTSANNEKMLIGLYRLNGSVVEVAPVSAENRTLRMHEFDLSKQSKGLYIICLQHENSRFRSSRVVTIK
jgi:glucuronoarabinoxylan endo-1,4-beta-xylanase